MLPHPMPSSRAAAAPGQALPRRLAVIELTKTKTVATISIAITTQVVALETLLRCVGGGNYID